MSPVLFVSPCPVAFRGNRPQLSRRRPWPVVWTTPSMAGSPPTNSSSQQSSNSSSDDADSSSGPLGDSQWVELAQQITPPTSSSEPLRDPPPKWTYPDGDPRDVGPDNPWKLWESAIEREKNATLMPRDVKAETDFWRGAARDLNSDVKTSSKNSENSSGPSQSPESPLKSNPFTVRSETTANESSSPPKQSPFNVSSSSQFNSDGSSPKTNDLPLNEQGLSVSPSTEIWREARGVTAKMSSMQSELRQELDNYNPFESSDEFRQMARDLVGPANDEPWEDKDPVPVSDQSEVGSGWNPDVDWMRYDDVGREKALRDPSIQQRVAEEAARQPKRDTFNNDFRSENAETGGGVDSFEGTDDSEGWQTFTDQRPSSSGSTLGATGGNELPGFLRNRMMSGSTYGSGRADMQNDIEELKRRGIELRDPKTDADAWRGIAKELKVDTGSSSGPDSVRPPTSDNDVKNVDEFPVGESVVEEMSSQDAVSGENESESWSRWQSSTENWSRANKDLKPRDPKQEVDAWRTSAKELLSGVDIPAEKNDGPTNASASSEESSAWSKWRESDENWKDQVLENEKDWNQGRSDTDNVYSVGSSNRSGVTEEPQARVRRNESVSAWLSFAKEVGQTGNDDASSNPTDSLDNPEQNSSENTKT